MDFIWDNPWQREFPDLRICSTLRFAIKQPGHARTLPRSRFRSAAVLGDRQYQSRLRDGIRQAHRFNGGERSQTPKSPPGDGTKACADHHLTQLFKALAAFAMPHALTSNLLHCVFSTKDRANSIPDPDALSRYMGGVAREKKIPLLIAGGTHDHLHLFIRPARRHAVGQGSAGIKGQQLTMVEPSWVEFRLARGIRRL